MWTLNHSHLAASEVQNYINGLDREIFSIKSASGTLFFHFVCFQTTISAGEFGELLLDDVFRLTGAKSERNLFLFQNGLLIVKRKEDGTFQFKNYIAVCTTIL